MNAIPRILVALTALATVAVPAPAPAAEPVTVTLTGPSVVDAGSCVTAGVTVQPPKPGTQVRLIEDGVAQVRDERTLDGSSAATFTVCEPWARIGEDVPFRAVWPTQGVEHTEGVSATWSLHVREAPWMVRIRRLVAGRGVGISVREAGTILYSRGAAAKRIPASNQKLLLSMATLATFGSDARLRTVAAGPPLDAGVVPGDLWIVGDGDPTVGRTAMRRLASALIAAGVRRIQGSVRGSKGGFRRDWFAEGWKRSFPREEVALPTALSFRGNESRGIHIRDPEKRAARYLTRRLRRAGVTVVGRPRSGRAPTGLTPLASVESPSVRSLLGYVNRSSWNFGAEVVGKRLGLAVRGAPGSIAKGAAAVDAWAAARGVDLAAYDGSGLSYANRVSPRGLTALLAHAETRPWGAALRTSLPKPGQGTLRHRLSGVAVRAKTGTLTRISALSGYVRLERTGTWAEFSILSSGMSKDRAVRIENRIVRILAASA